jgi:phosphate transport system substrate-binding protein
MWLRRSSKYRDAWANWRGVAGWPAGTSHVARLLAGVAIVLAAGLIAASAQTLTVAGATTFNNNLLVPHQGEIEALAGQKLIVVPNKTELGVVMLLEGSADLAMISTTLDGAMTSVKRNYPALPLERLRGFIIQRTRVAFSVHPGNPVRSASLAAIRRVLLGEIVNWRELGGADLPIKIVMVRDGGGIQLELESRLLKGSRITARNTIGVQISTQVNKVVEQEPAALGLAQIENMSQNNVLEIKTDRTIERELGLVTLGEPTPAMQAVIDAARAVAGTKLQ